MTWREKLWIIGLMLLAFTVLGLCFVVAAWIDLSNYLVDRLPYRRNSYGAEPIL